MLRPLYSDGAGATQRSWGAFWASALRDAPPLPAAVRAAVPEEGGFVVRPLTKPLPPEVLCVQNKGRCLLAPRREVHAELGFPEPALISNEVFAEVRYGLAPSVVQRLDFEDIREGTLRLFAIPGFEGDVRVVTVVDETAATEVLAQIGHAGMLGNAGLQRKRLSEFLHAAAASPSAAKWPTTAEVTSGNFAESLLQRPAPEELRGAAADESGLFPHQVATVTWMQGIEQKGAQCFQVAPLRFAGTSLGSSYDLTLPCGGVVAHPPGSGKTRIVAALAARDNDREALEGRVSVSENRPVDLRILGRWLQWLCGDASPKPPHPPQAPVVPQVAEPKLTLIVCPAHLVRQWQQELQGQGAVDTEVTDYESVEHIMFEASKWKRLVIDEPQDCPASENWQSLLALADGFRDDGAAIWLLCGTAPSQLESIGPLLLGRRNWHVAWRQSEWTGFPQLAHLIRTRFLADPPWACLPRPTLQWHNEPVVLRPRESTDAAVANLAGFVLDSVLLLSFGAGTAFAAAQERDQLLLQMGWYNCVGTSLLPPAEHALADWEGTVAQRSQQKLEKLAEDIAKLEATENQQGLRYQLAGGDAAMAPDLSFLAVETVRVHLEGMQDGPVSESACAAEWNALLPSRSYEGAVARGVGEAGCIALYDEPADGDFAAAATSAQAAGAIAVIFAAAELERPFGYPHERAPPGIPACMVSRRLAHALFSTVAANRPVRARVLLLAQESPEEDKDVEEGLVSAFIADDAVDTTLHRQLKALRGERERCERSLRFARQMRALLERNEAHCPVCFQSGAETEAFAVLPDCFHILCRACLEQQAGMDPTFGCPMCRTSVFRLDVVVFRAPGRPEPPVDEDDEDPTTVKTCCGDAEDCSCEGQGLEVASVQREVLPSKLQRLLSLLRELLASGPEERVLVYTQWATHVVYLREVLQQQGVPALALVGELRDTMDVLSRFGSPDEPRVLLLSSQRHSSGINLQMARHVVIVHPYCTPTATSQDSISRLQMLAFEAQAIGRVRRYPQKNTVHVHRLFAVGSVEEELYAGR
ncbi:putative SWI/SNF-related matrix-associated actin-dependent regulator of chromatin subfamily A member 3-like 3 [Symbiodinium microadriaticum]|uniref:Putative SWI/SNF-related matrix-associated actin-dependent regulator of chromatin subfamily A member 3-like 3 n=1 Tax=Symbiodinium microadriaticum TaxID=2951 RepID=A0A1Q9D5D3_SYMMI|nr:putative SWI/SNF-related matrix-associated actin-dependent regulator of chromatin subfamily A member 3-like 3 [Symbiodinium microadriaticum]CAE7868410.1 RAD5B [Symbiodinium microadriaticum]CAE7941326.1 RAD5B [Symbiodinium sp. KB8]